MPVISASKEFNSLYEVNEDPLVSDLNDMVFALLKRDRTLYNIHLQNFSTRMMATMGVSDLMGRRRVILEADALQSRRAVRQAGVLLIEDANPLTVPRVDFEEAIEDIASRVPQLALNAEEVAAIYRQDRGFALVGADTSKAVTKRVQRAITDAVKLGIPLTQTSRIVDEVLGDDWTRGYANMVVRTNLNTAYSAGRMRQAQDPDVQAITPGFRYDAIRDSSARQGRKQDGGENHLALDGLLGAVNDPIWNTYATPNGYG